MSKRVLNVTAIRNKLRLSREEFAALAQVDPVTVWRWERDGVPDRGPARALIERLRNEAAQRD